MSSPVPVFGTQDLTDYDGQVIDSFFIETDSPPDLKAVPMVIPPSAAIAPSRPTRILSNSLTIDPSWAPQLLYPADANRVGFEIRVSSPTAVATDGVRLASDQGQLLSAGRVFHGGTITGSTLGNHTGPIYVTTCDNTATGVASAVVSVETWVVTK